MQYRFYKNEKATIWYQDVYLVEAETEEQAQELFIKACKDGDESEYDEIELDYSEPIFETYSPISIEDNEGNSTIEIIDENGNLIWKNTNEIN